MLNYIVTLIKLPGRILNLFKVQHPLVSTNLHVGKCFKKAFD